MTSVLALPIASYGYAAVLFFVFVQSTGIPFPGAAVVVPVAAYAASTHDLSIAVILALAAIGGIGGSLCGFWLGKRYGLRLLLRYGRHVGLGEHRLKVTRYLYDRYGRIAILIGCVLAQWIVPLAGITNRPWRHVLPSLVAGPTVWALLFGLGGYVFGAGFHLVRGLQGIAITAVALLGLFRLIVLVERYVKDIDDTVETAYPDPVAGPRRP
jgi:membrane protein DedA with SNARE-associated domain